MALQASSMVRRLLHRELIVCQVMHNDCGPLSLGKRNGAALGLGGSRGDASWARPADKPSQKEGCTLHGTRTFFPMIRRERCSKDGVLVVPRTEERSTNRWRSAEVPLRGTRNQWIVFFLPRVDETAPHVGSVETIRFVQHLTPRVVSTNPQGYATQTAKICSQFLMPLGVVSPMSQVAQLLCSMVPLSSPVIILA